jgi:hypothetical protein
MHREIQTSKTRSFEVPCGRVVKGNLLCENTAGAKAVAELMGATMAIRERTLEENHGASQNLPENPCL